MSNTNTNDPNLMIVEQPYPGHNPPHMRGDVHLPDLTDNASFDVRSRAFYSLKNSRITFKRKLFKTKLCKSLMTGQDCPYGANCRFAHSLAELNYTDCLFGKQCYFVEYVDGQVKNKGTKQCNHIHPDETRDNFMVRVGLDKYGATSHRGLDLGLRSSRELIVEAPKDDIIEAVRKAVDDGHREFRVRVLQPDGGEPPTDEQG